MRAPARRWSRRDSGPRGSAPPSAGRGGRFHPPPRRVRLDGADIWDSGDKPVTDDLVTVAERPVKPGPHALTLRIDIRPGKKSKDTTSSATSPSTRSRSASLTASDARRDDRRRRRRSRPSTSRRSRSSSRRENDRAPPRPAAGPAARRAARGEGRPRTRGDPVSQYLTDLEQSGVLATPADAAALPQLKETLHAAEDDLVTGNPAGRPRACSASSSRRAGRASPTRPNTRRRSSRSAARSRARAPQIRRSVTCCACSTTASSTPTSPPAYRTMVDVALETREQAAILALLERIKLERSAARTTARTSAPTCAARSPTRRASRARRGAVRRGRPAVALSRRRRSTSAA